MPKKKNTDITAKGQGAKKLFNIQIESKKEDDKTGLGHAHLFNKVIWRVGDVAELLGCSIGHVYNLSSNDLIPKMKKGKFLFFDPNEVLEWLHQGEYYEYEN